jgi:3',5'-cyclic AMP phosphodiesterase CpdA
MVAKVKEGERVLDQWSPEYDSHGDVWWARHYGGGEDYEIHEGPYFSKAECDENVAKLNAAAEVYEYYRDWEGDYYPDDPAPEWYN